MDALYFLLALGFILALALLLRTLRALVTTERHYDKEQQRVVRVVDDLQKHEEDLALSITTEVHSEKDALRTIRAALITLRSEQNDNISAVQRRIDELWITLEKLERKMT
jgi:hypothetical protein